MRAFVLPVPILAVLTACSQGEVTATEPTTEPAPATVRAPGVEPAPAALDLAVVETPEGPLTITPLQHATFALSWKGHTVLVDPVADAIAAASTPLEPADLILVTDLHHDHLDPAQIAALRGPDAPVIAPDSAAADLPAVTILANGASAEPIPGLRVEAVPMYNLERRRPDSGELFHPPGRGNGYLVHLGETTVYISGDTECTPEMRALTDVDVALVCMNLPYTMPVEEAADCVRAFGPAVVYPYHHRGQDPTVFASALADLASTEVRVLDWYPASEDVTGEN